MSRRGESIYKRKDGRWEARFISCYENGKAKYQYVYARTYNAVKAKRNEIMSMPCQQTISNVKQNATFKEIAFRWLAEKEIIVKESTYTRYYRIVNVYLLPVFGDVPLSKIEFNKILGQLLTSDGKNGSQLSAKTITDILCVLKSILRFGVKNNYPCPNAENIVYPKKNKPKIKILPNNIRTAMEAQLWDSDDTVCIGILFSLYTGMRIGEICGLKWGDIDFVNATVIVSRTVERIANLKSGEKSKTKIVISEPKTESSIRIIPLPDYLKTHLLRLSKEKDKYILTGTEKPTEPHSFYMRYKTFLRKCNMPDYSFHALRHTFATRCVEHGFDAKSLSEILGHSNAAITFQLYVHPGIEQKRKQMELLMPNV